MQTRRTELGLDQLVEDFFGLNIRGFRTIRQMFTRPRKAFEAARDPDWCGQYTPSVRLVFSILTALGFLRFFWAGEETVFYQSFSQGFIDGSSEALGTEAERAALANDALGVYAASIPFAYLAAHGAMSQVMRVWGAGTGGVARLRLYMLAIVPSMTFTFFTSLLLPFVGGVMNLFGIVAFLGVMILDFVTALRGGVEATSRARRIGKAAVFVIGTVIATLIASALSIIAPIIVLVARLGPNGAGA